MKATIKSSAHDLHDPQESWLPERNRASKMLQRQNVTEIRVPSEIDLSDVIQVARRGLKCNFLQLFYSKLQEASYGHNSGLS